MSDFYIFLSFSHKIYFIWFINGTLEYQLSITDQTVEQKPYEACIIKIQLTSEFDPGVQNLASWSFKQIWRIYANCQKENIDQFQSRVFQFTISQRTQIKKKQYVQWRNYGKNHQTVLNQGVRDICQLEKLSSDKLQRRKVWNCWIYQLRRNLKENDQRLIFVCVFSKIIAFFSLIRFDCFF